MVERITKLQLDKTWRVFFQTQCSNCTWYRHWPSWGHIRTINFEIRFAHDTCTSI